LLSTNIQIKTYGTVISPVVSYGCETWPVTLREEHRLRVLRRVFEPKRGELTGDWRRLHYEEIYDLCSSPHLMRVIK
jgi:hypothetical protein